MPASRIPTGITSNAPPNSSSSPNQEHPPGSKHHPQGKQIQQPTEIRVSTRTTKGHPTRWTFLASLSTISQAANEPYEPKSYK